jgi:two-component system, LuxR family, response regulator FixJ
MEQHHDLAVQIAVVGIVDDEPAVRNSLKFSLEIEGLAVAVFAGANELLRERDLSRFRCLVVDQNMPGLNGLDLVAELRSRQIPVPIILITSNPSKALVARAETAGVPIVEKPLLGNALMDKVREAVGPRPLPSAS